MKRIYLIGFLTLAILLAGVTVFLQHTRNTGDHNVKTNTSAPSLPVKVVKLTAENAGSGKTYTAEELNQMAAAQNEKLYKMVGITPDMPPEQIRQKVREWYVAESAKMAAQDQHPIFFYGQTLDESNQPVAGVGVHFMLSNPPNPGPNGVLERDAQSDVNGYFTFSDATGKTLEVWLNKNGYYISKSNQISFDYTSYQPNPLQPEVFHLRKKGMGTDLITSKYGFTPWFDVHVPIDGTPIKADLLNRSTGENGQIEFSNIKPEYLQAKQATEWSFKMQIPDGGFVEESDEFPFEAPENGYQPIVQFDFQKEQPGWTWDLQRDYYIKFGNPPRYGHLHFETSIGSGVRLTYAINPDGSRYLEPKP